MNNSSRYALGAISSLLGLVVIRSAPSLGKDKGYSMANTMTGTDKSPITAHGKQVLEAELKRLLTEERPSVIRAIEEARAQGDISENAEYDAAKERQAMIEGRIASLQNAIATAEVVVPSEIKSDRIVFGATVTVLDLEEEDKTTYQIVGVDEADVKSGRISIMSPLARALIGRKTGEIITVKSPKGEKEYEVVSFLFK